jgi:alkaline phosphatase D
MNKVKSCVGNTQFYLTSSPIILLFVLFIGTFSSCVPVKTSGPYFGNGVHNGWADQNSIVLWTRLTVNPDLKVDGHPFVELQSGDMVRLDTLRDAEKIINEQIPEGLALSDMEGACPGSTGEVRLRYYPKNNPALFEQIEWSSVDSAKNYTKQWKLANLLPGTQYEYYLESRKIGSKQLASSITGTFETAPAPESKEEISFVVVTCHDYIRRDDSLGGHKIYPSMTKMDPDFYIHTGDVEYYDKKAPWAMTEELMRFKWDRLFALHFQREFWLNHTCYFMKDDHDVLRDDTHPGDWYGTVSFKRGLEIFDDEQFPSHDLFYKTIRWGQDLQIWLMEGRNYRSSNHIPDGPQKTIWGAAQKQWLFETLKNSDASFKVVISPGPIMGPDRLAKNDNYSNSKYQTEGDEIRSYLNQFSNVFLVNGDRHWQYVTHPEGSNLWEFSCGAGSDIHAGGWSQDKVMPEHRFLRVKGGFLSVMIDRENNNPRIKFSHHNVDGLVVHEETFGINQAEL